MKRRLGMTVALMATLGACGGKGAAVLERPTASSGELSSQEASDFYSDSAASFMTYSVGGVSGAAVSDSVSTSSALRSPQLAGGPLAVLQSVQALRAGDGLGCDPTMTSGARTDADADGIWASGVASFNCTFTLGSVFNLSGSIEMTDKNDAAAYAGFAAAFNAFTVKITSGNDSVELVTNAKFSSTKNASNNYDLSSDVELTASGALLGFYFDSTARPADATQPARAGNLDKFAGFVRAKVDDKTLVLALTGTDLTYDIVTCTGTHKSHFKTGTLAIRDGASHTYNVTFANCVPTVAQATL